MTFNEKIDKFMSDNKINNLKQLALEANIPYTTLRDFYEKQSADNSRLSTIRKLSKYMNCSMDYLAYNNITEMNEIRFDDGLDIEFGDSDKIVTAKIKLRLNKDQLDKLNDFLEKNSYNYSLTPSNKENNLDSKAVDNIDEIDKLYNKAKPHLSIDDEETIKLIANKTIKKYEEKQKKSDKELDK